MYAFQAHSKVLTTLKTLTKKKNWWHLLAFIDSVVQKPVLLLALLLEV